MKLLETITKLNRGTIRDAETGENPRDLESYLSDISSGEPVKRRAPGKTRKSVVSEYHYIIGADVPDVEHIISYYHNAGLKDVTDEGKTNLAKGEMTYIVTPLPSNDWYCVKAVQKNGKKIVVVNAKCLVRNPEKSPSLTADIIRTIWNEYPDPPLTLTGIAERDYKEYLKISGNKINFADENKKHVDLYDCTLADYIRPSYFGGWCYNHADEGHRYGTGIRLDVHSLYPSIMADRIPADMFPTEISDAWLFDSMKDDNTQTYFIHFSACFKAKQNTFPFVSYRTQSIIKHNAASSAIEISGRMIDAPIELTMAKPEYLAFHELYNVSRETFYDAIFFPLTDAPKSYVMANYHKKQALKGCGVKYIVQKVINNSLIGGMARLPEAFNTVYDDDMTRRTKTTEVKKESHIAIASYITASGRARLARLAAKLHDRFLYCDTDSLHLSGETIPECVTVSENLGDFAHETTFTGAIYWGQKKYIEWNDRESKVTLAGLPEQYAESLGLEFVIQNKKYAEDSLQYIIDHRKEFNAVGQSVMLIYAVIVDKIIKAPITANIEIPYKVKNSGWLLYRPGNMTKQPRIADDARKALWMIDNARSETTKRTAYV